MTNVIHDRLLVSILSEIRGFSLFSPSPVSSFLFFFFVPDLLLSSFLFSIPGTERDRRVILVCYTTFCTHLVSTLNDHHVVFSGQCLLNHLIP